MRLRQAPISMSLNRSPLCALLYLITIGVYQVTAQWSAYCCSDNCAATVNGGPSLDSSAIQSSLRLIIQKDGYSPVHCPPSPAPTMQNSTPTNFQPMQPTRQPTMVQQPSPASDSASCDPEASFKSFLNCSLKASPIKSCGDNRCMNNPENISGLIITGSLFSKIVTSGDLPSVGLTKLKWIELTSMSLSTLPYLEGLSELQTVSYNNISVPNVKNLNISNSYFAPAAQTISQISLSSNGLDSLPPALFANLALKSLDLSTNRLSQDALPFVNTSNMVSLNLNYNLFSGIPLFLQSATELYVTQLPAAPNCAKLGVGNCQIHIGGENFFNASGPDVDPAIVSLRATVTALQATVASLSVRNQTANTTANTTSDSTNAALQATIVQLQQQLNATNAVLSSLQRSINPQCLTSSSGRRLLAGGDPCVTNNQISAASSWDISPLFLCATALYNYVSTFDK